MSRRTGASDDRRAEGGPRPCLTTSPGSPRSARGPRTASGSSGCTRCSPRSATRSARIPPIHVVGTNGKSTATVTDRAAASRARGSPSARRSRRTCARWDERIRLDGRPRPTSRPRSRRVRPAAERVGATQFETITAAALAAFADAGVDVAVVEAGLGGRHDATNVLRSRVVLLTNVGLEHTDVLGETVEAIAREKLAVVHDDDSDSRPAGRHVRAARARRTDRRRRRARGGRGVRRPPDRRHRSRSPCPAGSSGGRRGPGRRPQSRRHRAGCVERLPRADYTVCRLDPGGQGRRRDAAPRSPRSAARFVATASSNARCAPRRRRSPSAPRGHFAHVEAIADPAAAVRARARARRAGARDGLALPARRSRAAERPVSGRVPHPERITRPRLRAARSRRRSSESRSPPGISSASFFSDADLTPCRSPTPSSTRAPGRSRAT